MRIDLKMEKMSQKALERKSNKPIMEKKRRARINHCLNQLKALILEADNERSRHSKLEKADILEMTVKYLQTFRAYHMHLQQLNQLQQHGQQQQQQIHQQLQQHAALGQQRLSGASSATGSPSPPMNLQLSQLALPLQLSLQAAVASVPLQQQSPVSPDSQNQQHSQTRLGGSQPHQQQHHLNHLGLSHLNHLNQHRPVALHTAHQQAQLSPTWRPW
jgi:hypothetical protein